MEDRGRRKKATWPADYLLHTVARYAIDSFTRSDNGSGQEHERLTMTTATTINYSEIHNAPSSLIWENLLALNAQFRVILHGSAAADQTEIIALMDRIRPIVEAKNTTKARAFFCANPELWFE